MRDVLDGADDALLGVAFVRHSGVNLLERQLKTAADGRLNVKRLSFVCALLARLASVQIVSRRPIELRLRRPTSP